MNLFFESGQGMLQLLRPRLNLLFEVLLCLSQRFLSALHSDISLDEIALRVDQFIVQPG